MPFTGNARSAAPVHPARTRWSRWQRVCRRGAGRSRRGRYLLAGQV